MTRRNIRSLIASSALTSMALISCGSGDTKSGTAGATSTTTGDTTTGDPGGGTGGSGASGKDGGGTTIPPGQVTGPTEGVTSVLNDGKLAQLTYLRATVDVDSAKISLFGVEGAKDYRVYALPSDADVSVNGDATIIKNGIYRCAGLRYQPKVPSGDEKDDPSDYVHTRVTGDFFGLGYTRTQADATLGFVYPEPGDGRIPVYALGSPTEDNDYYQDHFIATRLKTYTKSDTDRASLLGKGWRDDGIVFWVPAQASDQTITVSTADVKWGASGKLRVAVVPGPEQDTLKKKQSPTFVPVADVFKVQAPGTEPLMRVLYSAAGHDELAVGEAQFERILHQGNVPETTLRWSNITGPTTLVVEALDAVCPYQNGFLESQSLPGFQNTFGNVFPRLYTLPEIQAEVANGEVFLNGQDPMAIGTPHAVRRSFIQVAPGPNPDMDFFTTFSDNSLLDGLTRLNDRGMGGANLHATSPTTDLSTYIIRRDEKLTKSFPVTDNFYLSAGSYLGELHTAYSEDNASGGKFRLSVTQKGHLTADKYLWVTMSATSLSTGRRYPQIMVSPAALPIQDSFVPGPVNNMMLLAQTINDYPTSYLVEVCKNKYWEVNEQCPHFEFYDPDPNGAYLPVPEINDRIGLDKLNRYDLYLSTSRAFIFFDGIPYGCADLPDQFPVGDVNIAIGDVLYHSDADNARKYHPLVNDIMHWTTRRTFDNFGYKSGVDEPAWNYDILPCRKNFQ